MKNILLPVYNGTIKLSWVLFGYNNNNNTLTWRMILVFVKLKIFFSLNRRNFYDLGLIEFSLDHTFTICWPSTVLDLSSSQNFMFNIFMLHLSLSILHFYFSIILNFFIPRPYFNIYDGLNTKAQYFSLFFQWHSIVQDLEQDTMRQHSSSTVVWE